MKHYAQLKDNVVFALHSSSNESSVFGDNIVEIEAEDENLLNKKYVNGEFVNAPIIKYAILDESNDNTVIGIESTYFSSDVKGPIIEDSSVKVLWKWNGESFIAPEITSPVEIILAPTVDPIVEEQALPE